MEEQINATETGEANPAPVTGNGVGGVAVLCAIVLVT